MNLSKEKKIRKYKK